MDGKQTVEVAGKSGQLKVDSVRDFLRTKIVVLDTDDIHSARIDEAIRIYTDGIAEEYRLYNDYYDDSIPNEQKVFKHDDQTNLRDHNSNLYEHRRVSISIPGLPGHLEAMFQDARSYINSEKHIGFFDPEKGVMNGATRLYFEGKRNANIASVYHQEKQHDSKILAYASQKNTAQVLRDGDMVD
jgi:hypothetical protein